MSDISLYNKNQLEKYEHHKDELNKLYLNKTAIGGIAGYYWTSTEVLNSYLNAYAWLENFLNGIQNQDSKDTPDYKVRAIRAF